MTKPKKPAPRKKRASTAKRVERAPTPEDGGGSSTFPIVGIGASAGGLEALGLFLQNVPPASGMAFLVVQHQDPTHTGMLRELLQRTTPMTVVSAADGMAVQPDCVYVIPPNKDMSILHGVLHLLDPVAARGLRLPIDFLFRSLADDAEELAIGVVLSGMGSDGTLGLKSIKGKAGVVLVQDPDSAAFDGMPRSAIDAGLADFIAPPHELPGKIAEYLGAAPRRAVQGTAEAGQPQSAIEKIVILLRAQTGHDFTHYKRNTVVRRIERRMGIHQIERIDTYVTLLRENPQELELLFKELLIGVTSFFRDPEAWDDVAAQAVPAVLKDRPPSRAVRIWVPGCSTGEEAYSLAILFREAMDQAGPAGSHALQIFATDLDRDAIARARAGEYPANIAADVSPERLDRYFVQSDSGYRIAKRIRETVIFAPQNVVMDPPFTKVDIVSCRNVLIYLKPELQKRLLPQFHHSLNPGGFLFLGSAETAGDWGDLFAPPTGVARLYRRLDATPLMERAHYPASLSPALFHAPPPPRAGRPPPNLQSLAERLLLQRFSPAAVLVTEKGDIVFVSGRTGQYLEPAAGKANWNVFAMARDGLRHELSAAFRKALGQDGDPVTRKGIRVSTDAGPRAVDLVVQVIAEPAELHGLVMIVFAHAELPPDPPAAGTHAASDHDAEDGATSESLQRELDMARHEARTVSEQMQSIHEEAEAANEELQSANEELQSTNEELTTSREEMQSMNEELRTLNQELLAKVDEGARLNSDLRNLLDNAEIATVFLDSALRVRLFTAGSNRVFKLIDGDIGRPISDIASGLDYPTLIDDAREVLRTLMPSDRCAAGSEGTTVRVRITPYRTGDNMIDGVTITFTDVTAEKALEDRLAAREAALRQRPADPDSSRG